MKRLALFFALSTMAIAAMAQNPAASPVVNPAVAPVIADAVVKKPAKDEGADRNCLKETGSRLAPTADRKGRKCINAAGHAYDKDEIDRTGATDLKDALRRLDPTVH